MFALVRKQSIKMNTFRPTAREARVRHYSTAGNADWSKKASPEASQGAGFVEIGSGRSGNRYAAKLGTTTRCADRCHKLYPKQVTQIGKTRTC